MMIRYIDRNSKDGRKILNDTQRILNECANIKPGDRIKFENIYFNYHERREYKNGGYHDWYFLAYEDQLNVPYSIGYYNRKDEHPFWSVAEHMSFNPFGHSTEFLDMMIDKVIKKGQVK